MPVLGIFMTLINVLANPEEIMYLKNVSFVCILDTKKSSSGFLYMSVTFNLTTSLI